jgi:dTDP-4-amino-4,6-dideoxygalactose transaminase
VPTPAIPFNRPSVVGREFEYIADAISNGHIASSGPFSKQAATLLREELSAAEALLTTSCTSALEMSAMLLDRQPGDTIIVPSFTFVSSALAFAREGFRIVFADIEPTTLGIDPAHVAELIDSHTRAVVAVHYGGVACDLDGLEAVLGQHPRVELIEDNAHGLFGSHRGKPLGSFGRFSTLSFHETKNIVCGEGGALIVNSASDVDRARIILDKGTNRQSFLMGQIDKYSWKDTGSSFGLSDMNAAFLLAQLEEREAILAKRRFVYETYIERLTPIAESLGVVLPALRAGGESGYHLFHILVPDVDIRSKALQGMRDRGIHTTFHYIPLHSSEGGQHYSDGQSQCPVTDDVSARLLRLPFYNELTSDDIDIVVNGLTEYLTD